MYNTEAFSPVCFHGGGSLRLRGQEITYKTICEDNVFYDETGKPLATIFSYSYFRTNVADAASRPVLFCFNGGPGASSVSVHAGCFGAKRVKYPDSPRAETALPPYEVIDNPDCLLDVADLVMVDPIGTGFGLLLDEEADKRFYGIDEDAEALLMFIRRWLSRYGRWASPKYLVGESYGCTRAATTAGIGLTGGPARSHNIAFDGVILLGNTVTVTKYFNRGAPVEPAVEALPTMAAIHWYHNHPTDQPLEEFVKEAAVFAAREYLPALFRGEVLAKAEREQLKKKLMAYTGVSEDYLEARDLRLERISFCRELLRGKNEVVSLMDGRFTRPAFHPLYREGTPGFQADATSERYAPFFQAALLGEMAQGLGIRDFDRSFAPSSDFGTELAPGSRWNFENAGLISGERLSFAMQSNRRMRTFFANGWYDLVTQTGIVWHTMTHTHLPSDRTFMKGYPSGHMIFIGEDNVRQLSEDIRRFVCGQAPEAPTALPVL